MKKYFIYPLILTLFLTSCAKNEDEISKVYYDSIKIENSKLTNKKSYIWYTSWENEIFLASKVWWKIVSLEKNIWDKVSKNEVVATLDASEAKTWIYSSNEVISNLENLKTQTSNMFDDQLNSLDQKILQVEKQIDVVKLQSLWIKTWETDTKNSISKQIETIETQIQTSKIQIENISLKLENTKNSFLQEEKDIYQNSDISIKNSLIFLESVYDFYDTTFWVSNKNKNLNQDIKIYLWAKDSSKKNLLEKNIWEISLEIENLKNISSNSNDETIKKLNTYYDFFANNLRDILKLWYEVFDNSIAWSNLSQEKINILKQQAKDFELKNEQIILSINWNYFTWLKWSLDNINKLKNTKTQTLDSLEKELLIAQKSLETLNTQKNQIITSWEAQINQISTNDAISQKQIDLTKDQLEEIKLQKKSLLSQKNSQLASIDAQISQIKAQKNDASVMVENWKVISLIDWVITNKFLDIWSIVWAWTPIYLVSSDIEKKINVWVDDEIINSIKIWDKIEFTIDNEIKIYSWVIKTISPNKDEITKKTNIEISFKNDFIKNWSIAKVYFSLENDDISWVLIPNKAIISNYNLPQVFLIKDGIANLKHIEIISQNDENSLVLWLELWDEIIVAWMWNIYDQMQLN